MFKKMKCLKCGTLMSMNEYRCPGCGAVITSIDGEELTAEEREERANKHFNRKAISFIADFYYFVFLIFTIVIVTLIVASIFIQG